MKTILLTVMTFFAAHSAFAAAVKLSPDPKKITCTISESDDSNGTDRETARVTILLDASGIATSVRLQRLLDKKEASAFADGDLDMKFDNLRHLVTHGVRPNKVIDHDGPNLIFDWNINRVEFIQASDEAGNSVEILIHDHNYSGVPGSSVSYKKDGKDYNTSLATTSCTGAVKLK